VQDETATDPTPVKRSRVRRSTRSQVKLEDVARLANVSTATASRVINSPHSVTEGTRQRVERAIAELGWIPHGAAQALASLRTRTIGALIPTLGHQTIAAMLESLQQHLGIAGYTLLLGRMDESEEHTIEQAAKMIRQGVDGLVLMGEDHAPELYAMLERRKIFYVIAYTTGGLGHSNCIGLDNYREMTRMVRHLLDLGHTSFGLIARTFDRNDRTRHRIHAVRDTLAAAGLAVRPQHFRVMPEWTIGCGREGMRAILGENLHPTAVVCTNDYLACGALIEARSSGFMVPEDISITGFDDLELALHMDPPLTTIHVPAAEMGQTIAEYVVKSLESGTCPLPPPVEARFVVRRSTAPPSARRQNSTHSVSSSG
jgi:LacI family transcriptional regulator